MMASISSFVGFFPSTSAYSSSPSKEKSSFHSANRRLAIPYMPKLPLCRKLVIQGQTRPRLNGDSHALGVLISQTFAKLVAKCLTYAFQKVSQRSIMTLRHGQCNPIFVGVLVLELVLGGSSSTEYPGIKHPLVPKLFQFFGGGTGHVHPRVRINKTGQTHLPLVPVQFVDIG